MTSPSSPLIVGAGPAGLASALFLQRAGWRPRIIDQLLEPSRWSKALAVNPRTLDILAPTGITARMFELGKAITGVHFYRDRELVGELGFAGVHPRYPFMLALSQATTEALLTEALQAAGGSVERGTKLVECDPVDEGVDVTLQRARDGQRERARYACVLAADGAHSVIREQLHMAFPGSALPHPWYLADAPLRTQLSGDCAHVFFFEDGAFLFLIRVVDRFLGGASPAPLWRVLGNRPAPLSQLVAAEQAGTAVWESTFHVPHRILERMSRGRVFFAGDAAHLHSPVGARGMNLGIEDARVFAQLAIAGRLDDYHRMRHDVDAQVVRDVSLLSHVVDGGSPAFRAVRSRLLPVAIRRRFVRTRMLSRLTGLDHPAPEH